MVGKAPVIHYRPKWQNYTLCGINCVQKPGTFALNEAGRNITCKKCKGSDRYPKGGK